MSEIDIEKLRKEGWIETIFNIEAMAVKKEPLEKSLKEHVEKIEKLKQVRIYEKNFSDIEEVENPPKKVQKAYSQIVEIKLFIVDLTSLFSIIMMYGPSSVEILGPKKKEINMDEMQNLSNGLAGLIHQFAQAGSGGIVMTPGK